MTKSSMIIVILTALVVGIGASAAQTPNRASALDDAFDQIQKSDEELRAANNIHDGQIKALQVQVAGIQPAPSSTQSAPPAPAAQNGKIDYTRYDRLVRDCASWTPQPSKKEELAQKYSGLSEEDFQALDQKCLRIQNAQLGQRQQVGQVIAPPAPGVIQEYGPAATTAVYNEERDGQIEVEQTSYGRRGYVGRGVGVCPPGFKMEEGMCGRYREVTGPSKYDESDAQAHCQIGTTRAITVQGPYGPRKVYQTCNRHH